jgi:hypothetical protein
VIKRLEFVEGRDSLIDVREKRSPSKIGGFEMRKNEAILYLEALELIKELCNDLGIDTPTESPEQYDYRHKCLDAVIPTVEEYQEAERKALERERKLNR